jgi:hypothetical protein
MRRAAPWHLPTFTRQVKSLVSNIPAHTETLPARNHETLGESKAAVPYDRRRGGIGSLSGGDTPGRSCHSDRNGGITDTFPEYTFGLLETLDSANSHGKTTALLGHAIGPLVRPDLVAIARRVLPMINLISLREGLHSLPLLRSLGVPQDRITITGDDAIEMAYSRQAIVSGGPRNYLGVNIRRASYSGIGSHGMERVRSAIIQVVQRLGCQVLSVPVSQHPDESDSHSFRDLLHSHADVSESGETIRTPMELIDQI